MQNAFVVLKKFDMSKSVIWLLLFMVFLFVERKRKSRLITYNMYCKKYMVVGELLA